jgi:transcription elongation factor Elf1
MIQPNPYKLICPKCNFEKIVAPKSDSLTSVDSLPFCPKCKLSMNIKESSFFDNLLTKSKVLK